MDAIKEQNQNKPFTILLAFIAGVTLFRLLLILAGSADLSGDEMQYWDWSRHPSLSYYSKPPGVAYLILISRSIFGNTALGIRFWPLVFSALSAITLYKLTAKKYDANTALRAAGMFLLVPLFMAYGIAMTPDTPMIFFWILSLLLFHMAVAEGKTRAWPLLGVSLGLGLLCKYAILFFIPCAALYFIFTPQHRKHLKSPWPYLALIIAIAFLTPVLIWNSQNDWVNFRHDLGHTKLDQGFRIDILSILDLAGSQVVLVSPILFVLMFMAVRSYRKRDPLAFWFSVPILAGFFVKSIQGKVQANWPMAAYPAAFLPLAHQFLAGYPKLTEKAKSWVRAGVTTSVVMTLLAAVFFSAPSLLSLMGVPPEYDPTRRIRGYSQLADVVHEFRETERMENREEPFVFTDYYMLTAAMAFYLPDNPTVYYVNPGSRRMNHYDILPWFGDRIGDNAIFVCQDGIAGFIAEAFESVTQHEVPIEDRNGKVFRNFRVYECRNYLGMPRPEPYGY